jgi:hypothetical protein
LTDADGWDKRSVIVDRLTGNISRKYIDCSLVGIQARIGILEYALGKGKIVVANTYSTSNEEQALPVNRFAETFNLFDPFAGPNIGEASPVPEIFRGNLASPIGLGISGMPQLADTATRLMKAVMTYLRHGSVYYHYAIEDIPEVGPGSGEYGPINHMFPITPVALHKGWIEARERIITVLPGKYKWKHPRKPDVHRFDLTGREVTHTYVISKIGSSWEVEVTTFPWEEIIVIE